MEKELKKVIVAVVGSANTGKSTAIKQLACKFPFLEKKTIFPDDNEENNDVVRYGKYQNQEGKELTLGVCSFGDNNSMLEEYFIPLIEKHSCDVIVVACHNYQDTERNTFNYIVKAARKYGYRLITTSILRDDAMDTMNNEDKRTNEVIYILNDIFADNIINLIKTII